MRDGESLLERMLAAGTAITRAGVEDALGLPPGERVRGIAAALVGGDAGAAISGAAALYRDGFAARTVVEGLVAALGAALHAELGLKDAGPEARLDGADVPRLLKLQAALDEQESRFARAADQQSLELALTHALLAADTGGRERTGRRWRGRPGGPDATPEPPGKGTRQPARPPRRRGTGGERPGRGLRPWRAPRPAAPARTPAPDVPPPAPTGGSWPDVVRQASIQLRAFLKPARQHAEPGYVSLSYDERSAFHAKQVAAKFDDIGRIVLKVFGPVTFELIAPEGGRRVNLGGPGGGGNGGGAPAPTPAPTPATAPQPAVPQPAPSRPPAGGGAGRARVAHPGAIHPGSPGPRGRAVRSGPGRAAPRRTRAGLRSAAVRRGGGAVATLPPRPERRVPPRSPDDVALAPLPDDPFAGEHLTGAPPAPADATGGDRLPPPARERELYIVEPITEEPDWNAFGSPDLLGGLPPEEDMPFGNVTLPAPPSRAVPATQVLPPPPRSAPAPAAPEGPTPTAPVMAAPSRPGDIRAHANYELIRSRFSGRVREIGKNRNVPAAPAAEDDSDDTDDSET
ncbi:hypothetical protein ACFQDE_07835 [Deinococcus caeni]|uniref:hypothetical protein n=1 Tax=Deinococcus caeni TaxID=569127 RepID=UPI00361DD73D